MKQTFLTSNSKIVPSLNAVKTAARHLKVPLTIMDRPERNKRKRIEQPLAKVSMSPSPQKKQQKKQKRKYLEIDSSPNEKEYEVECIIDEKIQGGKTLYKLKWTGYPETTWKKEDDLTNCQDALNDWKSDRKKKRKLESDPMEMNSGYG